MLVLVVVAICVVEFVPTEFAFARLALVGIQVIRTKPLCTAFFADNHRPLTTEVTVALRLRPVHPLICCLTLAASDRRLTAMAHQARLFPFWWPVKLMLVKHEPAELFEALFALMLVVLARRVPSHCAVRAHEVSVEASMISHHL